MCKDSESCWICSGVRVWRDAPGSTREEVAFSAHMNE